MKAGARGVLTRASVGRHLSQLVSGMKIDPINVAWFGEDHDLPDRAPLFGGLVRRFPMNAQAALSALGETRFDAAIVRLGNRELSLQVVAAATELTAVVVVDLDATPESLAAALAAGADLVAVHDDPASLRSAVVCAVKAARARAALGALSASLEVGAWVVDPAGRSLFESRAAALLGSGATAVGIVVPRSDGTAVDSSADGLLSAAAHADELVHVMDEQGTERPVSRSVRALETPAGRVGVAIHRDDTARVDLERKLMLAQKVETVNQLSRGVVHDLNNAFCIIQSFADLLAESTDPSDDRYADIEEISRASIRAATMTRSLSSYQKRGSGQVESVNLQEHLRRLEPLAKRLLGERAELAIDASAPATVLCDPALFEQAVLDAVSILRPQRGGGLVTISSAEEERWTTLLVTGSLESEEAARVDALFDLMRFAGGEARVVEAGLALCFPRSHRQVGDGKAPRAQAAETILIVEDERPVRLAMSRVLGSLGYQVLEARHTADAKTFAAGRSIDLVVSDVVLPDGDGIALLHELCGSAPRARGMLVTGYAESELGSRSSGLPVLMKPFTTLELARKVRQALDAPLAQPSGRLVPTRLT